MCPLQGHDSKRTRGCSKRLLGECSVDTQRQKFFGQKCTKATFGGEMSSQSRSCGHFAASRPGQNAADEVTRMMQTQIGLKEGNSCFEMTTSESGPKTQ